MYQTQNKVKGQSFVIIAIAKEVNFLKEMLLVMIYQIFNATRLTQSFTYEHKCNSIKENCKRNNNDW